MIDIHAHYIRSELEMLRKCNYNINLLVPCVPIHILGRKTLMG